MLYEVITNIDDGYFGGRDSTGKLFVDRSKFPSGMESLVEYIHGKGLKAGIYTDAGQNTCGSIWDNDKNGIGRITSYSIHYTKLYDNIPSSQPEDYSKAGFPIIVDVNNDGEITVDDVVMSNEVPKIYFGFGNTFTYKNWDLDVFVYSQLGVNKYNYAWEWADAASLANQTNNENKYAFDLWSSETNQGGRLPGYAYEASGVSLPGGAGIDVMYQKASFLRFRNITLGYNLTGKQLGAA